MTGCKFLEKIIHTQRSEEPPVLSALVPLLQRLLDGLLGVLTLRNLLEGVVRHCALQAFQLEGIAGGHQMVVVDDLDERLDRRALGLLGLRHAAGDFRGISFNTGDDGVGERMSLGTRIQGLDDHDLDRKSTSV